MSQAASIDASGASPDISREVMSRIATQAILMGQQRFEQMLQPQENSFDYSDIGTSDTGDEEDEEGDQE